jgi:hypothetical protein
MKKEKIRVLTSADEAVEELWRIIAAAVSIPILVIIFSNAIERNVFSIGLYGWLVILVCIPFLIWIALSLIYQHRRRNTVFALKQEMIERGLGQMIQTFITRFGKEITDKKASAWRPRHGYAFDWKRLEDFRDNMIEHGMDLPKKNFMRDEKLDPFTEAILTTYLDERERVYLRVSLETRETHLFDELQTEEDFEFLILRLYEAMGYSCMRIKEKGATIVATKGGEKVAVRLQCPGKGDEVSAIQDILGAMKKLASNRSAIVSTTPFGPEEQALAYANAVEIIDRKKLQQYLEQYLHESWQ